MAIDPSDRLKFRPPNYFEAADPLERVIHSIKGANRREMVRRKAREGRLDDIAPEILDPKLSDELRGMTGRLHPSEMGGEYLPDLQQNDVEIARITIASTTQDVTCVYASRQRSQIAYRVVDEYDGQTLTEKTKRTSKLPLTLGALIEFFLSAWDLIGVLDMNFGDDGYDPKEIDDFYSGSSEFYPQFDSEIRRRVGTWVQAERAKRGLDQQPNDEDEPPTSDDEAGGCAS